MAENLTLSKEQAAIPAPLVPSILASSRTPEVLASTEDNMMERERYTTAEMFSKKGKNFRSTKAQNYLLVSANRFLFTGNHNYSLLL